MPRKKPEAQKAHIGRDPATVRNIMLRMSDSYVDDLDVLCSINHRSRREIVEILVKEAALELKSNPSARINPL